MKEKMTSQPSKITEESKEKLRELLNKNNSKSEG